MIKGQTSIGGNGKQNLLFPLTYMYITQDEYGNYSHMGLTAMDFQGYGAKGRIYDCPYYAPCDLKCIERTSYIVYWTSIDEVNKIDGTIGKVSFVFMHDENTEVWKVGDICRQGEHIGNTGTAGRVTGDHVHMQGVNGTSFARFKNKQGKIQYVNQEHLYNMCGVNDTVLVKDKNHPWEKWGKTPIPPSKDDDIIRLYNSGVLNFGLRKWR